MKTYMYCEPMPIYDESGSEVGYSDHTIYMTENEILDFYWEYWCDRMKEVEPNKPELLTKENCIDDWIMIHWAQEVESSE